MAAFDFRERLLKGLGGEWPEPGDLKPTQTAEPMQKDG